MRVQVDEDEEKEDEHTEGLDGKPGQKIETIEDSKSPRKSDFDAEVADDDLERSIHTVDVNLFNKINEEEIGVKNDPDNYIQGEYKNKDSDIEEGYI